MCICGETKKSVCHIHVTEPCESFSPTVMGLFCPRKVIVSDQIDMKTTTLMDKIRFYGSCAGLNTVSCGISHINSVPDNNLPCCLSSSS